MAGCVWIAMQHHMMQHQAYGQGYGGPPRRPYGQLAERPSMPRAKGEEDENLHRAVNRRILDYTGTMIKQMMKDE